MKFSCTAIRVRRMLAVNLLLIFILLLPGTVAAKPFKAQGHSFSFPGGKRGREAVSALQKKLPRLASRYGKSAARLKKHFLQDRDLWLDPADNLLYLCNFDISESGMLPGPEAAAIPAVPQELDQTFLLHSLPGASRVIYLDFDGHTTANTSWNSHFTDGADIVSSPYDFNGNSASFSDAELGRIQNIWARVSEDFAMYEIDVTTEDPGVEALRRSGSGDGNYGVRVVISPSSGWFGNAGGVAYVGSFDWGSDTPVFVFSDRLGNGNEKYVTDAATHETGHSLGLSHDGQVGGSEYYSGHGSWAPIMGVGYYAPITQWSKGEYAGANNTEDDLAVMLNNGARYRQDDHGNWIDSATMLNGDTLSAAGIIERTGDADVFGFQTSGGNVSISVDPANLDPNLDILLQLLDDGGNVINQDDPYYILPARLDINLPAGTYYILVDGVGTGDPDSGYSDYGSLGQYFIFGILPTTQVPPDAPADLSAVPVSASQIDLHWTDTSSNENGFAIERSANTTGNWIKIAYTAAGITTYNDMGLNVNTTYYYRVSAYNVVGDSAYSETASATTFDLPPEAPSGLLATVFADNRIVLNWIDNSGNETGFVIQRSPDGNNGWEEIATAADNVTTYTDTGLASGTAYFYRVSAYNLNGGSAFSNTATATTPEIAPENPTNLAAITASAYEIQLNWHDNSDGETGFTVERSPDGFAPWAEIATLAGNSTGYSDSSLSPETTYYYRVFSFNPAGASGYSNVAAATTEAAPPYIDQTVDHEAAVAGIVGNSFTATHAYDSVLETIMEETSGGSQGSRYSYLEHKWMIQVEPGSSMTLFANVWASVSPAGDSFVFSYSTDDELYNEMFTVSAAADDGSYYIYPLPENHSGTIYIRVTDTLRSAGYYDAETLYIDHLFIRTENYPDAPPAAPSALAATGIDYDAIALTWLDHADNELGFYIERFPDALNGWELIGTTGPDAATFIDSGLSPGETYYYQVQAFNSAGVSIFTDIASATTMGADALHVATLDPHKETNRRGLDVFVSVAVRDQNDNPVAGVTVEGSWDTGDTGGCFTDDSGQCTVSTLIRLRRRFYITSTGYTVTGLSRDGYNYDPAGNAESSIVIPIP